MEPVSPCIFNLGTLESFNSHEHGLGHEICYLPSRAGAGEGRHRRLVLNVLRPLLLILPAAVVGPPLLQGPPDLGLVEVLHEVPLVPDAALDHPLLLLVVSPLLLRDGPEQVVYPLPLHDVRQDERAPLGGGPLHRRPGKVADIEANSFGWDLKERE